uniref:Nucleolar protein 10 n=1 Tax=Phallusia mammillata TaxID=59560 RepID=A0A6F9DLR8_9ASCI|nr:nucleolar protein 10 [Phallusia mammillata]
MQVSNANNIKIYNLSCGKSLPEFISDQKRRALLKKDEGLRRRIELIQDFDMPTVSSNVKMSPDGQYIFTAGTYKPRVKCYDVNHLSMKFERCFDAEVVALDVLSQDYSKLVFLLNDRTVEFHTQQGKHYNVRIPKFGRAMAYHPSNCDLMLVGSGSEIYRLNLDQGRFLKSYETQSPELHCCVINPDHHLVVVGGSDGHVECWDPRSRCRAGIMQTAAHVQDFVDDNSSAMVTALKFNGALNLAVGTSSGQVLLYDMRNNRPFVIKDHRYDLPIHSIAFNNENNFVISSDARCVKLWQERTGEAVTAVEMEKDINEMCLIDNSGLFFLANESPKLHTYFIPMLGPAPRWCSFLDSLTEEMEENPVHEIYDDYKFLTQKDVESLGLSNLIGTSLLRAYMHGYFVDMRLYHKAAMIANPFAFKEYRNQKIAEKIEEGRMKRVQIKKLPKVNKQLAERLLSRAEDQDLTSGKKKKMKREAASLLDDPRFKSMFEDSSFQVDQESEEFRLLNPVVSKQFEKQRSNERKESSLVEATSDNENGSHSGVSSSENEEEERKWVKESKKAHRNVHNKTAAARERRRAEDAETTIAPRMFEIKGDEAIDGQRFSTLDDLEKFGSEEIQLARKRKASATLGERIDEAERHMSVKTHKGPGFQMGAKQATFRVEKVDAKQKQRTEEEKRHRDERRSVRRPANKLKRVKGGRDSFFKR